MGCDPFPVPPAQSPWDFNPRTPCGVRPAEIQRIAKAEQQFQSTHPVWGATKYRPPDMHSFRISIHAPRVGCDSGKYTVHYGPRPFQSTHPVWGATRTITGSTGRPAQFQSTHPVWGATTSPPWTVRILPISIHAPRVGCDVVGKRNYPVSIRISIHAPRVGCDPRGRPSSTPTNYFNPRTPCGVRRHYGAGRQGRQGDFNPRTPCGVRPRLGQLPGDPRDISIHAPRVGCDSPRT